MLMIFYHALTCADAVQSMGADQAGMVMLADGCGQFALAMGVELDLTEKAMGIRSRRYSMIVDDLEVRTALCTLPLIESLWCMAISTAQLTCMANSIWYSCLKAPSRSLCSKFRSLFCCFAVESLWCTHLTH